MKALDSGATLATLFAAAAVLILAALAVGGDIAAAVPGHIWGFGFGCW